MAPSPAVYAETCPRCLCSRLFVCLDTPGGQATYRCSGCEWAFSLTTKSPTGTTNAAITAGTSTALSVASGGASFTSGMILVVDSGSLTEIVTVSGTPTGTSVPVPGGFAHSHASGAAFGQMLLTPSQAASQADTPVSGWPAAQPATF
ncbi:MAG TPA: hypothetical protein VME19_17755 [Streptosporangiaceae bacterium]|nr:hypothetical protein [Streptosporangiaceae bacterium]